MKKWPHIQRYRAIFTSSKEEIKELVLNIETF
ncbi:MAG: hypothetical protein ACI9RM_000912, partial [Ulvibacter sp.]